MTKDELQEQNDTIYYWGMYVDAEDPMMDNNGVGHKPVPSGDARNPVLDLTLRGASKGFADGVYNIYVRRYPNLTIWGKGFEDNGVVIKDEKFVPVPTLKAIERVMYGDKHHVYLERLDYDETRNAFVLQMGS